MCNVTEKELEDKHVFECGECGGYIYSGDNYFEINNEIICIEELEQVRKEMNKMEGKKPMR